MSETAYVIAKQKIEQARRTEASELSLTDLRLKTVPPELWDLTNLKALWLNGNDLTELSRDVSHLSKLKHLVLATNKLTSLPNEICELERLQVLTLGGNSLTNLPTDFSNLSNLVKLSLSGSRFGRIPKEIQSLSKLKSLRMNGVGLTDDLDGLATLPLLERLAMSSNNIHHLPSSLFALPRLIELSLHSNHISSLPAAIGQLSRLKYLSLNFNDLRGLPPEIGSLVNLEELILNNNCIESLPAEIGKLTALRSLIVRGNRLTTLPPAIGGLRNLKHLRLRVNDIITLPKDLGRIAGIQSVSLSAPEKLTFPPADIGRLGGNAIIRYLRAAEKGEETVLESKLLLVGEGTVGKTWLYEALNGRPNGGNKSATGATIGIEIGPLLVDQPPTGNVQMRLNCWDFAGQDITHATHQFFFSERTLFLVCWNARAGWEAGKLRKWLTNVRDRAPGARVLLVATHKDEQHSDYPEKELREEFEQIVGTFKVSSKTGEGVPELRDAIAIQAKLLPMMGLRWPTSWRAAEQAVLSLRLRSPFVNLRVVYDTMASCGVGKDDASVLLRWLHELGEVLHYADVPELAEIVMLDPQWVTRHVGAVLASREVQEARGILTRQCLSELWPDMDDYVRLHLLGMMERFDLAYRIPDVPDHRSLVVERLQQDTADYESRWDGVANQPEVRLRYRLKAMHPGIPTWFIARCHRFTLGLHWLRGVLFADDRRAPRHLALIIANEAERTVDFTVRGPQPWTFLPLLKDGFEDTIRKRYPGLEYECMVPCPGKRKDQTPCDYEFSMADLEALRWPEDIEHEPQFEHRCMRCRTTFLIDKLLLGLSRAPSRDGEKLDEILKAVKAEGEMTRSQFSAELEETRRFVQLAFIDEWNKAQELVDQSCPTIFALYPVGGATITRSSKLRLQLYCMNPGCWHSVGSEGRCEFQPRRAGFITATRWVRNGLRWLRPASALLPSGSQLAGEWTKGLHDFAKHAENELKFTADLFAEFKEIPETDEDESIELGKGKRPISQSEKVELRQLRAFLDQLEFPVKPYGGLKRVRTPEGHILWLCAEHASDFTRAV
jgi:Leucine-rich repeat (LRR) protein/GTPase SAR1 family protein